MNSIHSSRRHPDYYLRAEWHDYRSKCFYLVTFNTLDTTPKLSMVNGDIMSGRVSAQVSLTLTGEIVEKSIFLLPIIFPIVEISKYCIMPDHVHILIHIKQKSDTHLGEVIRRLKSECTKSYREAFPNSKTANTKTSLFHNGFNDRIVYKTGQLESFKKYVIDNPRRFYIKKSFPDFFNSCRIVSIDGRKFQIYGNFLLLRNPQKVSVIVSKNHSGEEKAWRKRRYKELAKDCGVYVSPFISDKEKKIRDYGLERGVSLIRISHEGFSERFKPSGKEFDLCSQGRLLLVSPYEYSTLKNDVSRMDCIAMNKIADEIANADGSMKLINALADFR